MTHNYHPARRLTPSGLPECSVLRFSHSKGKMHERQKEQCGRRRCFLIKILGTVQVSPEEKARLKLQADMEELSVSAYLRRRFFGGRSLIAHTDAMMIRELRRIGGLLKHNFETLRKSDAGADMLERQERALELLISAIEHRGVPGHDSEDSQTGNPR